MVEEETISEISNKTSEMEGKTFQSIKIDVVKPKVHIGLLGSIAFGVGSMIGSGIFISPTGALKHAGSIGMSLVIWSICGVLSLLFGLVYGEFGALLPQSGGDFNYINKGLGPLPAFLVVWTAPLFIYTAGMAVLALVFADYLLAFLFQSCTPSVILTKIIAAAMITTLGIVNAWSAKLGAYTQRFCTVMKVAALLLISIAGVVFLGQGHIDNFKNSFEGSATDVTSYTLATYNCMFAYGGFTRIGDIAEEIINPKRNIPRAVIISVISVTTIYVVTNISFFILLSKPDLLLSNAVAYDWALKGIKHVAFLIPISVLLSVYGASNGNSFGTSRVMFAAARAGQFPEVMSFLHVKSSVPVISVIIMHVISLLMLIPGNIGTLINFMGFLSFILMMLTSISLLKIRYQRRKEIRNTDDFRTPILVPILSALLCLFFVITPFVTSPQIELLYSLVIVMAGLVIYIPFVHFGVKVPGTDTLTKLSQLVCNICPVKKTD